jgi:hypothetical protein
MLNTWKNLTKFTNCKIEKKRKRKEKKLVQRFRCALYINYRKTCCETKCNFRQGSTVWGPMNSSNLIDPKL